MKKLVVLLIIGIATQFVFVSKGAVYGGTISELEKKIESLEKENRQLEIELAGLTAYTKIGNDSLEVVFSLHEAEDLSLAVAQR